MSTGSSYTNQSAASRPITALGATAQFQTYASAAYEPDANVSPPATSSLLANLIGSSDPFIRAPFEGSKILQTLIDIGVVAFWVGLSLLCMFASIGAFFALLFVKF